MSVAFKVGRAMALSLGVVLALLAMVAFADADFRCFDGLPASDTCFDARAAGRFFAVSAVSAWGLAVVFSHLAYR